MNIVEVFNVLSLRARPADWEDQLAMHGLMMGDDVVIRTSMSRYDEDTAQGTAAKSLAASFKEVVTPAEAVAIYDRVAALPELDFFHMDGCFLRDYRMSAEIFDMRVIPQKVWAVRPSKTENLFVTYPDHSHASWNNHVAPVLKVAFDDGIENVVLDPSLFDGPVRVAQWGRVMGIDARAYDVVPYLGTPAFEVGSFAQMTKNAFHPASRYGDELIDYSIQRMFGNKKTKPSRLFTSDVRLMVEKPEKYAAFLVRKTALSM